MLRELGLEPYYRSDRHRLAYDFYEPCLAQACRYDRAVGYFTSTSLAAAARGLRAFVSREGRMRLVASPHLTDEDVKAIQEGYDSRHDVVQRALRRALPIEIPDPVRRRLQFLAWLIAEERLDVKIALVEGENHLGVYHEKVGIFADEVDDMVVFTGSANESVGGLLANFEALEVFRSWLPEDAARAHRWADGFEALWSNQTPGLLVSDFPQDISNQIVERYKPSRRLIRGREELDDVAGREELDDVAYTASERAPFGIPRLPDGLRLREYQQDAVRSWFAANGRGVWEMATGTGKTFAALVATAHAYRRLADHGRALAVVVVCPFQHLVEQWAGAAAEFGIRAIRCSGGRARWMSTLGTALAAASAQEIPFVLAVATNQTFAGDSFQAHLRSYRGDLLLIGDEVHNLGAPTLNRALPESAAYRLGLSATPERHFDPEGTSQVFAYFGTTVFAYTLAQAIAAHALVPYRYYPILVSLTSDEQEAYLSLTQRIARLAAKDDELIPEAAQGPLQMALFQRARLTGRAEGKIEVLRRLIKPLRHTSHNLVYCADSGVANGGVSQVDAVVHVLGRELGMRANTYTHLTTSQERDERRRRFASGDLQALVAIRCLDEGIDIPEARCGFILASTTNPRQFIQRRGRLLRRSPGKERADLYDFIVAPPEVSSDRKVWQVERRLVGRELLRVVELADAATNGPEAIGRLLELRRRYELLGI
ncbi:DEAD/DEAH box helicase family protein [Nonomuraea sp. MTCD27]|uniref:DEAD/DEAH box helicase family protein n=1 Tax=Nonomuraea sp. MTCD27 TaxID=1676747 RepID=UPI0035C2389D